MKAGNTMYKSLRMIISLILVISVTAGTGVHTAYAENKSVETEFVEFGSYPQTLVSDPQLVSELNSQNISWTSYGYYSGTGTYDDGKMKPSEYMRYTDVEYEGNKYRAVTFDTFRPIFTGWETSEYATTYQDNNGYICGQTYWFSYEPLRWRVVDPEKGYIICESIVDSQPFSNCINYNGKAYYMDSQHYDYSNYYVNSSIREWLNTDFINTAFNENEKEKIAVNYMDDFWKDIEDKVFLPSANEMKNVSIWKDDKSRITSGTDYAKCQGLFETDGRSFWRLRSPSDWSHAACDVSSDGTLYSYDYYYNIYPYHTSFTGTGIRPAVKLSSLSDATLKKTKGSVTAPGSDREPVKMSFSEKLKALVKGITGITKYYLSSDFTASENVISVLDSLSTGINIPCMESGWAREYDLERSTYQTIKDKGFDYIRLPANLWCMLDGDGTLNESAAAGLDKALEYALGSGLTVILDLHGWEDLNSNPSVENIETIVSIWQQISERYKELPDRLCFEIYNEPNNSSGKMSNARWNYIQNRVAAAIREIDSDRIIVLSTMNYNSAYTLSALRYKHKDPCIIIDVHNYEPMEYTHQGAEWIEVFNNTKTPYTEEASERFAEAIKKAADFKKKTGTRILIGEFGVYLRVADEQGVNEFLTRAVEVMKNNDLPRAYWELYAGFGAYDCDTKEWKPFVTDALLN